MLDAESWYEPLHWNFQEASDDVKAGNKTGQTSLCLLVMLHWSLGEEKKEKGLSLFYIAVFDRSIFCKCGASTTNLSFKRKSTSYSIS